ncbi:hypothetical protein T01_10134 [Trichinella spiralis]|uniref:Reverse transcriptase/retrotransposon-derived protein RNase H-like domain-containing protein n=1 Tax=Trichinella spiralis TaxID=6334 RepID=A0A0V1C048_TRISP|nr:hypothetical protein T01_10134 [Trichinella spiralis]
MGSGKTDVRDWDQSLQAIVDPFRVHYFRALTRSKVEFAWNPELNKLILLLIESPDLTIYYPNLPSIVTTDASNVGIGTVLFKVHGDSIELTGTFGSRALAAAERKYSVVEKEA